MERFKKHIYISNLLAKERLGILSPEEQETLSKWIQSDVHNEKLAEALRSQLLSDLNKPMPDEVKAWQKFSQNNQIPNLHSSRKISRLWLGIAGAAASIALILGTTLWIQQYNDSKTDKVTVNSLMTESIYKDSKGILLLSDGKTTELSVKTSPDSSYDLATLAEKTPAHTGEAALNTIIVPKGAEFKVKLPDGTIAWINSDSKLTFPNKFDTDKREIRVEGEVCLNVVHNPRQPFVVHIKNQRIEVLGTLFNIEAYSGYPTKTTLVQGRIAIESNTKKTILSPNQQLVQGLDGRTSVYSVNALESIQWTEGNFEFNDENIVDIMNKLSRWYNVDFIFNDEEKKQGRFTVQVERTNSLKDILKKMELTGTIHFKLKDKQIYIY